MEMSTLTYVNRRSAGALRRGLSLLAAVVALAGLVLPTTPAAAGTAWDYPEFPYPATTYSEPYRGQFHFSSQAGWMNDPNGLVYANGHYHFFYQHNPHGLNWDTMHWGHATSPDLVHWTQKPIALEPDVHPAALWSGGGVVDTANSSGLKTGSADPIVVFSNTNGVSIFYSNDDGKTFQSYDGGRKQIDIPADSRDPKVFWDAARHRWAMVVWASQDGANTVHFYTSPDLLHWSAASTYKADWLWECPDMYQLPVDGNAANKKWVLTTAAGKYVVGDFDGTTFHTDWTAPQQMDLGTNWAGGGFYAAQTFTNTPGGRVIQMAWQGGNQGSTWTGNATFPVTLGLAGTPDGPRMTRTPIAELASISSPGRTWTGKVVTGDPATDPFNGIGADTYQITAQFDLAGTTAGRFGFDLHRRSDGSSDRTLVYDVAAQTLDGKPLKPRNGKVKLQLLVDRGQLEVFADGGLYSLSENDSFDSSSVSRGLRLFAEGGQVKADSLSLKTIASTWGTGQSTLETNLTDPWHASGGTWTDVTGGKRASADGDGFFLSAAQGTDAIYQGDVTLDTAQAAGLTFRATSKGEGYTATLDMNGMVKLWRPGRDIAVYKTPISAGRTYHVKVQTNGDRIRVWLDNGADPVIDATDSTYPSGVFGANAYKGTATVQNLYTGNTGFTAFPAGRWSPHGGTWTVTPGGLRGSSAGDGFYLSDKTGTDFTYEGDVQVTNGTAAGLTFRAGGDGTGYTANVDTGGVVKLWRPGRDIAVHTTPIAPGRTYHLRVQAQDDRIRVWLGDAADPVIDATDSTFLSGDFGANTFAGNSIIQNLKIS